MSSTKPQVNFRIELRPTYDTGKLKWHLYISEDNDFNQNKIDVFGFELVHAFTHFHHAKARMLKMASAYQSYHYIVVNQNSEITEQEIVGVEVAQDQPDLFETETTPQPEYFSKVVYRIIKYAPNHYVLDFQQWQSASKNASIEQIHAYGHETLGEFSSYGKAHKAMTLHGSAYPAYQYISSGMTGNSTHLTVYETKNVFKPNQTELWFKETVAPAGSATHAGATVSPP